MFLKNLLAYFVVIFCVISATTGLSNPTPDPIDLDTSTAKLCEELPSKLTLTIGLLNTFTFINTGYGVEAITNSYRVPPTGILLTGGILGKNTYKMVLADYFWSNSTSAPASNSIDGLSTPIQVRAYFLNVKYSNYATYIQACYNHKDALAVLVFNIQAEGYYDSAEFQQFGEYLLKIKKAGSSIVSSPLPLYSWFDQFHTVQYYYSYSGSFIFVSDKTKQIPCATVIEFPKLGQPSISIPQFKTLLQLSDFEGKPLINTLKPVPTAGNRTILQVVGDMELIVPI